MSKFCQKNFKPIIDKITVFGRIFIVFSFSFILFTPLKAFSQNGIVKTISDFDGRISQHSFIENKLVFVGDNETIDDEIWVYDLASKEIERVSNRVEHYANSFFLYENYVLFNQNKFIVQYDLVSKELDTLSTELDNFISTNFQNAVRIDSSVYFTENRLLWKLNIETKELVFIGSEGFIFGNGSQHIYQRYSQNINVYDITAQESIEVYSSDYNYEISNSAVSGDNLLFLYHRIGSSEMSLAKYDANLKTTTTLEVPIKRVNDDGLYVFHKIDDDHLIFYDKTSYTFWLYNNQQGQITEIDQVDNEGNALRSYGKFVSNNNEVFFWGNISGIGPCIVKYDLSTSKFTYEISIPNQYASTSYPLQLFENNRIITKVKPYQSNQHIIIDIDLISNSIDTIANNPTTTDPIFFQNSLIYEMPPPIYGPNELYKYDFSSKQSSLIEGSYLPDEDIFTYQYKLTQYNNEFVFMWDNQGVFRTIDDSYIDKMEDVDACDYFVFLGDTLMSSGNYRKKVAGSTIDTVYTVNLTINSIESGITEYYNTGTESSYLRAKEKNADSYQWFLCEDQTPIQNATSRDFYYPSEGYYGVIITKGGCVDTTGCPVFVQLNENACNTYDFFGEQLSSSGSYEYFQETYNSTDTVFQLELTIDEINTSIVQMEDSLSNDYVYLVSEEENADHYQWLNCDDFTPIEGEVNSSFRASVDGEYALLINKGACQDTTYCYSPTILAVKNQQINTIIYPNPTNSDVKIDLTHFSNNLKIRIYNLNGVIIKEYTAKQLREGSSVIVSDKPGVYNVCISENDYFNCQKVVVK